MNTLNYRAPADKLQRKAFPSVSFIIPTLNAGKLLRGCLENIRKQDYPRENIEILIVDGGSTDDTLEVAKQFNCKIVHNPRKLCGPGVALGILEARNDLNIFFAADNRLARTDWLKLMIKPFADSQGVVGASGPFFVDRNDRSLNRYFSWVESSPFHYFLCVNEASRKLYENTYKVMEETPEYKILRMTVEKFPILGLANGFVLCKAILKDKGPGGDPLLNVVEKALAEDLDDILPVVKLIERGYKIAYVSEGGVFHYHLENYQQFFQKYRWKIRNNILSGLAYTNLRAYLSRKRKLKERLWILYSFSIIWPLLDAAHQLKRDRDIAWLHHPVVCFMLSAIGILTVLEHPRLSFGYILRRLREL